MRLVLNYKRKSSVATLKYTAPEIQFTLPSPINSYPTCALTNSNPGAMYFKWPLTLSSDSWLHTQIYGWVSKAWISLARETRMVWVHFKTAYRLYGHTCIEPPLVYSSPVGRFVPSSISLNVYIDPWLVPTAVTEKSNFESACPNMYACAEWHMISKILTRLAETNKRFASSDLLTEVLCL